MSRLFGVSLDSRTSKTRMKKITKYKRLCEWESEIYLNYFIKMRLDIIPSTLEVATPLDWLETMGKFLSTNPIAQ